MLRIETSTWREADGFEPSKGFALDIPLKSSGIWKPEFRSQKPE